eukprot:5561289-Alexandrium_andersonii.AAC.1
MAGRSSAQAQGDGDEEPEGEPPQMVQPMRIRNRCRRVVRGLLPLLAMLNRVPDPEPEEQLDAIEFFCGVKSVTGGFRYLNMNAVGVDKAHAEERSLLTSSGFMIALSLIRRLRPGSVTFGQRLGISETATA